MLNDLSSVLDGKEISVKSFSMLFRQLLSQARYSLPPRTLDSITIASALTARLSSPKIVFITGVNEGIFPMLPAQDRLFSNDEREKLSAEGFNKNKSTVNFISNARLASYKALSSASEKLYISYSLTSCFNLNCPLPDNFIRSVSHRVGLKQAVDILSLSL